MGALDSFLNILDCAWSKAQGKKTIFKRPKRGDRGDHVAIYQERINNHLGFKALEADGIFGAQTSQETIKLKRKLDLYPSDIVVDQVLDLVGIALLKADEPDRDNDSPTITKPNQKYDGKLNIVELDVTWQKRNFATSNGMPDYLLIHYTVSGQSPANARGVADYFASTPKTLGYQVACPIVDRNGTLYVSKGWDIMKHWNNNAGSGSYGNVRSGMSSRALALELTSWGLLDSASTPKVPVDQRRSVSAKDNRKAGVYHIFTPKQEKTIVNAYIYLKRRNPNFSHEKVIGHDEWAPNRKSDPGGSLSRTMPELRDYLKTIDWR